MVVAIRRLVGKMYGYIEAISKTGTDVLLDLTKHVRCTIVCPVENKNVFDSYAGVLAVIRLLAYEVFIKSSQKGRDYMMATERQHDMLSEFD